MADIRLVNLALRHLLKLQAVGAVCQGCPDYRECLERWPARKLEDALIRWVYGRPGVLEQAMEGENENC